MTVTKKMIFTSMFLATGTLLSITFHTLPLPLPAFMFSPLHLPVFVCAIICGKKYGAICGVLMPFVSLLVTGMPPLFPTAVAMSFELAVYAIITGAMLEQKMFNLPVMAKAYIALIAAQLLGRAAGGLVTAILLGMNGKPYLFSAFVTGYFVKTLPAVILQLIIIPPIAIKFKSEKNKNQ